MAKQEKERSLASHMVRGSAWSIGFRWAMRLLGLVSTIILARLLTPADYGVVTIAMIVAGTLEVLSQTGQQLALIRHPSPTREHYDSAFTVSVLLGFVLGTAIWLTAPITVAYFHEPRAEPIVHIVAFRSVLRGFENIGVTRFQRDFRFRAQFVYNVTPSIVSFFVTLVAAFTLRNYWALVIGIMSEQAVTIVLSYVLEPYRPRFSVAKVREIWSFSIWSFMRNIGVYVNQNVDKFGVGGFAGAATMGRYEVATDLAASPTLEINAPMMNVLVPVMAKVQSDPERRRDLYLRVLYWSALICTSTAVGVALVTSDLVDLVLGPKWGDVKPLMPWLAFAFGTQAATANVYYVFDTVGRPKVSARLQWLRFLTLVAVVVPTAFLMRSAVAVAMGRFAVTLAITPFLFATIAPVLDVKVSDFVRTFWRPLAASLAMAVVVQSLNAFLPFSGPARLLLDVLLGASAYVGTVMFTWQLVGAPDGPETVALDYFKRALQILGRVKPADATPARNANLTAELAHRSVAAPSKSSPE
jgi:O-antigen/teichoic acid export membrane protein